MGAEEVEDDDEAFEEKMLHLTKKLEQQFTESAKLETIDPSENSQANIYKALIPVLADSVSTKKSVFDIVTDSLEQKNT
ncbi:hypothetical protein, partial [Nodularia sp. LEGE 04288]|uniref:hypothetical protein n=1 Tax=Nodularia sp. LEGE 04288 TaxID=1828639 RepID=UPI001D0F9DBE